MTRGSAGALVAIALVSGLALRTARLDVRPMHHDEANQAVKFGVLVEHGEYRYDPHDHHGPTLYYLSLPAAWLRGQTTLAALDERTLRGVTVFFGAATILLLALFASGIGRTATTVSAWLFALSPAMVFYSRMFIQESLLVCFALAFVVALGRAVTGGGIGWAAMAGAAAGLAAATKETSVILLSAAVAACAIALWSLGAAGEARTEPRGRPRWTNAALVALGVAVAVAVIFYSSLFTAPAGILDVLRAAGPYLDRGTAPADHAHPWHYYLGLLTWFSSGGLRWSEGAVLGLAVAGLASAFRRPEPARPRRAFWQRYVSGFVLLTAAIFSAISYKTPWNLLPFYAGAIILAGIGFSAVLHATGSRVLRAALVSALAGACVHLAWQAWRASVTYAADPRNPYVYAQTVPDAVRMATRIQDLAALHPDREQMQVSVVAPPHEQWPLPWYLRAMPHVGYWTAPGDPLALQAPVIVAAMPYIDDLDQALGDRYVAEFYGLRPDVLLMLYIERELWDRFLAEVAGRARSPAGTTPRALWSRWDTLDVTVRATSDWRLVQESRR